jgi:DnaK suppressor protein
MDNDRARALLQAERARVESLLAQSLAAADDDRASENVEIAISDAAEPLTAEGVEDAVVAQLRERLDAVRRAEDRLQAGTFGRSVLTGQPIPDDRLEADPTAEATVQEAGGR